MDDRDAADHPSAPQLKRRRPISNNPQRQPVLNKKSRRGIRAPGGFSKLNFYFLLQLIPSESSVGSSITAVTVSP